MAKKMKKPDKALLITGVAILTAILAVTIVFGCIKTAVVPAKFDKPLSIQVIYEGTYSEERNKNSKELIFEGSTLKEFNKVYNAFADATDFSVLRGVIENQWFKKVKIATYKDDEGNKQLKSYTKAELKDHVAGDITKLQEVKKDKKNKDQEPQKEEVVVGHEYLVVYRYNPNEEKRIAEVSGQTIKYDTVWFFVRDTKGEIGEFKMFLIDSDALAGDDEYVVYEIKAYAQLTKIYNAVEEVYKA